MTKNTLHTIELSNLTSVTGGVSNEQLAAGALSRAAFGDKAASSLIEQCRSTFPASKDSALAKLMFEQDGLTDRQTNCVGNALR